MQPCASPHHASEGACHEIWIRDWQHEWTQFSIGTGADDEILSGGRTNLYNIHTYTYIHTHTHTHTHIHTQPRSAEMMSMKHAHKYSHGARDDRVDTYMRACACAYRVSLCSRSVEFDHGCERVGGVTECREGNTTSQILDTPHNTQHITTQHNTCSHSQHQHT